MANETYSIEIPIIVDDQLDAPLQQAERKINRFEKSAQKTNDRMVRMFGREIKLRIGAVDRISPIARNIKSNLRGLTSKAWDVTLRVKDKASGVLRGITGGIRKVAGMLTNPLALLGVGGGVGGITKFGIDMVVDRENITMAFETLLGSASKAAKRVKELTTFAGETPFLRDDIYETSRVLEVFTKGALSTGKGLKMVGDIASGTGQEYKEVGLWIGRLYDAMASGRPVGEMTARLQEMGAISGEGRNQLEKLAESGKDISEIWPEVERVFSRFDGQMEKMSRGLGNMLTSVKSFFRETVLLRWGQGIESELRPVLESFRKWRKENPEQVEAIGDAIQRVARVTAGSVIEFFERAWERIYTVINSPEFDQATFSEKVQMLVGAGVKDVADWLAGPGKEILTSAFVTLGEASIRAYITGMKALGESAVEELKQGNIAGAAIPGTAMWLLGGGAIARGAWGLGKGVAKGGKWAAGKLSPPNAMAAAEAATTTAGGAGIAGKVLPALGKIKPWLGRLGVPIAVGLETMNIAQAENKRTAAVTGTGRVTGMVAGGKIGMAAGGAVGSAPGSAIGGILGGIGGWLGGEKAAKKINEVLDGIDFEQLKENAVSMWNTVKQNGIEVWESAQDKASEVSTRISEFFTMENLLKGAGHAFGYLESTLFSSEWWMSKWENVQDWTTEKWESIAEVWQSAKDAIDTTLFDSEWWLEKWENVRTWTDEKWQSMVEVWEAAKEVLDSTLFSNEWWLEKWENVRAWTDEKWQEINEIWQNARSKIESTLFNKDWWMGKWENVRSWASEKLSGISASIEGWVGSFEEGRESGRKSAQKHAIGGVFSSPHLGLVAEAGPEVIIPLSTGMRNRALSLYEETGKRLGIKPYATGGILTQPHLGLVAEAGPEAIIPLSTGMRGRGLSLWEEAGRRLGVRSYAEGGLAGSVSIVAPAPSGTSYPGTFQSGAAVGTVNINFNVSAPDGDGQDVLQAIRNNYKTIAEEVTDIIAGSLENAYHNMPTKQPTKR